MSAPPISEKTHKAPAEPDLGDPLDRGALDRMTVRMLP